MNMNDSQDITRHRKGQDTSITSVNSSGQDSGIAEARCPCGRSAHNSEESSGCSYEDSLKSTHNRDIKTFRHGPENRFLRRASFNNHAFDGRKYNPRRQSFSENLQRHFPVVERIGSTGISRQISSPNVSSPSYFLNGKKNYRQKEIANEPVVDYDHSEVDDVFDTRLDRRLSGRDKKESYMELGQAVFVATPAAAEMIRRQGSERIVFARPL